MTIGEFIEQMAKDYYAKYNEYPKRLLINKAEGIAMVKEYNKELNNPYFMKWLNGTQMDDVYMIPDKRNDVKIYIVVKQ